MFFLGLCRFLPGPPTSSHNTEIFRIYCLLFEGRLARSVSLIVNHSVNLTDCISSPFKEPNQQGPQQRAERREEGLVHLQLNSSNKEIV